jgi:hypothetical protein
MFEVGTALAAASVRHLFGDAYRALDDRQFVRAELHL